MITFTVPQERGNDSTVTVTETVVSGWPSPVKALRFDSDQSLTSQSDRALNVIRAIEEYARERGYTQQDEGKFHMIFAYSPDDHSRFTEYQLRQQIIADPRYQTAKSNAEAATAKITRQYGAAIRQVKNLIFALEKSCEAHLDEVRQYMKDTQIAIASELDIPDHVREEERKRLLNPRWPYHKVERDHYSDYGQGHDTLPDDLDYLFSLLDKPKAEMHLDNLVTR